MAIAKKSPRPARRALASPVEETPVIGGRFLAAALIVGAMAFIPFAPLPNGWFERPSEKPTSTAADWKVGGSAVVRISVVTGDFNTLACVSDQVVDGAHCGFRGETEIWPSAPGEPLDDNKKNVIQPYWTFPDNQMLMVAGLWAEPHVAMRLHQEPPAAVPAKKLARFVARCTLRFVGELPASKIRWGLGQQWSAGAASVVARPDSCEIEKGE